MTSTELAEKLNSNRFTISTAIRGLVRRGEIGWVRVGNVRRYTVMK